MSMQSYDKGKAVAVAYLDLSKDFNTASHSIFLEKLTAPGLAMCTLHWVKTVWMAGPVEWC